MNTSDRNLGFSMLPIMQSGAAKNLSINFPLEPQQPQYTDVQMEKLFVAILLSVFVQY